MNQPPPPPQFPPARPQPWQQQQWAPPGYATLPPPPQPVATPRWVDVVGTIGTLAGALGLIAGGIPLGLLAIALGFVARSGARRVGAKPGGSSSWAIGVGAVAFIAAVVLLAVAVVG